MSLKRNVLQEISQTLDVILKKIDQENNDYLSGMRLDKKQKKLLLEAMENFEKKLQAFWIRQKIEYLKIMKRLPELIKKDLKKVYKVKKAILSEEYENQLIEIITGFIFVNEEAEIDQLAALYLSFSNSFFAEFAKLCACSVKNSRFEPSQGLSQKAIDWIDQHKIKFATKVNQTTQDAITQSLKESLSKGIGTLSAGNKLVSDVPNHFNQNTHNEKSKKLSKIIDAKTYNMLYQSIEQQQCFEFYRARRIARTETISAMNAATLEGWRQSKVVQGKEWLCSCDHRSRLWHKEANGQKVALEESFIVGGEKMLHPGDSSLGASAENVIHCRCTMKSILNYQMRR